MMLWVSFELVPGSFSRLCMKIRLVNVGNGFPTNAGLSVSSQAPVRLVHWFQKKWQDHLDAKGILRDEVNEAINHRLFGLSMWAVSLALIVHPNF